jgi:putative peptide zinc metalloprotease protein
VPENRVVLSLAPDPTWQPLIEDVVRHFAQRMRFSRRLTEMLAYATLEACDNLALRARECGVEDECRIELSASADAVTVDIAYNAKIPLNPHQTETYEVPDADSDPDSIKADALWLFLIKRRMDKVFFRVEGARHVLSLVKYRRQEGREGELWVMRLTPRLSPDAQLDLHFAEEGGQVMGLLYNPKSGAALRLKPSELFVVERIDGQSSMYDIYMEHIDERGLLSPNALATLYESLEKNGMLLVEKRSGKRGIGFLRRLLNPNFSIPGADALVEEIYLRVRWLVSPLGAALLVLLGVSGLHPYFAHFSSLQPVADLEAFYESTPLALAALYGLTMLMVAAHELAHGLLCKHFGGRVYRLGVMFYLAMFIFYCDTTSAYAFPKTSQKVLVSLAGPITTFACLGLGLWAAAGSTGGPWEYIWISFCYICFFGLVMNFNPFIKMDAYYMLMDVLKIANLRERSFSYIWGRVLDWLRPRTAQSNSSTESVAPTQREMRVFWWYGILGALFSLMFVALPLIHYGRLLSQQSASQGRLVWGGIILTLLTLRLANQAYQQFYSWRRKEYRIH